LPPPLLVPLGVQPSAIPAGINRPLPSAMARLQSGNVTLPSTMG